MGVYIQEETNSFQRHYSMSQDVTRVESLRKPICAYRTAVSYGVAVSSSHLLGVRNSYLQYVYSTGTVATPLAVKQAVKQFS
jgi:hypothetical protein